MKKLLLLFLPLMLAFSSCGTDGSPKENSSSQNENVVEVRFDENSMMGISNPNPTTLPRFSGKYTLLPLENTDDYTFIKWAMWEAGDISWDDENIHEVTEIDTNKALAILLMPILRLTEYHVNYYDGTELLTSKTFTHKTRYFDELRTSIEYACPSKDHYSSSWDTSLDDMVTRLKTKLENIDVHAVHTPNSYNIVFECNDPSITIESKPFEYGTTGNDIFKYLEKEGRMLAGVFKDKERTQKINNDYIINKNETLYVAYGEIIHLQTLSQLKSIPNDNYNTYILDNDIDADGGSLFSIQTFNGIFDGNNHKIYNALHADNETEQTYGIFSINNGIIKDLLFEDVTCTIGNLGRNQNAYLGFLTGINNGTIDNVDIIDSGIKLKGSTATYDYNIRSELGTYAGRNNGIIKDSEIKNNTQTNFEFVSTYGYKTGALWKPGYETEMAYCGSFVGANYGEIKNVSSKASVKCDYGYQNYNGNSETHINTTLRVGGIAGSNEGENNIIENSSFLGTVISTHDKPGKFLEGATTEIGGIVGVNYRGTLEKCYVESSSIKNQKAPHVARIGGFTGNNDEGARIKSCHIKDTMVEDVNSDNLANYNQGATMIGLNKGMIQTSFSENSSIKNTYYGESGDYFALLVAYNDAGTINKCVGVGNIYNSNNGSGFAHVQKGTYNTGSGLVSKSYYLINETTASYIYSEDSGFTDLETEANAKAESLWRDNLHYENAGWTLNNGTYPSL